MKKSSNKQYAQALYEVTKDLSGTDLNQALGAFINLLVHDRKFTQANNIIIEFEKFEKKQEGIIELEITSARQLDEKTIETIKKAFGEKVEETLGVDESLIGGVRVKMEDKILDASIKSQLHLLKSNLLKSV